MRPIALALLALALLGGCGGDHAPDGDGPRPRPAELSDDQVIEGWIDALNAGRFERAAAYFAPGAIVEQTQEFRLEDRAEAVFFNRTLPCRAELTDVEDEGGTSVAAFKLSEGRDGRCGPGEGAGGEARVRFRIREGKIREWRQLPDAPVPRGDVV